VIALIVVVSLISLALELRRGRHESRAEATASTEDTIRF
jgi:hypothetical protein